jgi:Domain of unknown function (DUF305)
LLVRASPGRQSQEYEMRKINRACLAPSLGVAALFLIAAPAVAEPAAAPAAEHAGHEHPAAAAAAGGAELNETSKAYEGAMEKMHKDMTIPYTNDVDVDFVRGMIPHHQGAIDQATVLLKYSKNLRLRLLAGGIIATQKREIRFMKYWLAEHEKGIESNDMPVWLKSDPHANDDPADAPGDDTGKKP